MAVLIYTFPMMSSPASAFPFLDQTISNLNSKKSEFAKMSPLLRAQLLEEIGRRLNRLQYKWVALEASEKGEPGDNSVKGEVHMSGPVPTGRLLRMLSISMREIATRGLPNARDRKTSTRSDGRLVVNVMPFDSWDRLVFPGFSADVWMKSHITKDSLERNQAESYRNPDQAGKVSLVLGAGNQSSIPITDSLHKLFVDNSGVLLKMNPVNAYLGPVFAEILEPLIELGFIDIVYGGAEVGSYLCHHPGINDIHITGSAETHDAIVWGQKSDRKKRIEKNEPLVLKPITSELGNVTPIVVIPGPWSRSDIDFHAENIAAMLVNNASFNCVAGKLLVLPRQWKHYEELKNAISLAIKRAPLRRAYYPGARDRWTRFVAGNPNAAVFGPITDEKLPWALISDLDFEREDERFFNTEAFCGVMAEVALAGESAEEFLSNAVRFCNEKVWGTLAIHLLIHPKTRKNSASEKAFQQALDTLRYGTISINQWAGLGFGLMNTTWGAYPEHTSANIGSGRGVVHNTFMFDHPEKSVVWGPFRPVTKPVWFHTHRGASKMGGPLVGFSIRPTWTGLLRVLRHALG